MAVQVAGQGGDVQGRPIGRIFVGPRAERAAVLVFRRARHGLEARIDRGIVVHPGPGDGHIVEFRAAQNGLAGEGAAPGPAIDAHPLGIHFRMALGQLADGGDVVVDADLGELDVAGIAVGVGAPRRAPAIGHRHGEAEAGQAGLPHRIARLNGFHEVARRDIDLRAAIDGVDHRMPAARQGALRGVVHRVDVGFAIGRLHRLPGRGLPAGGEQGGGVGPFQFGQHLAVLGGAQQGDRRLIHGGIAVDGQAEIGPHLRFARRHPEQHADDRHGVGLEHVIGIFGGQQQRLAAIQPGLVQMAVVRVPAGFPAASGEVDLPGFLIHRVNVEHRPIAGADGVLQFPGLRIAQLQMPPAAFGGIPDCFVAIAQQPDVGAVVHQGVELHSGGGAFLHHQG